MITFFRRLSERYSFTNEYEKAKILTALRNKIQNNLFNYQRPRYFRITNEETKLGTITKVIQKSTSKCILSISLIELDRDICYSEDYFWEPTKVE